MEYENRYASKGVAGTALGLGAGALGLGLLSGNGFGGLFGNGNCGCSENNPVNRYELDMANQLAAKDARIGLLESNIYTDQKISDTYKTLNDQINVLSAEVRANKDEQNGINLQQAVYNGTNTAALGCIQSQIAQLYSLTKLVVPNTAVCPGWGNVTITPETTTAV